MKVVVKLASSDDGRVRVWCPALPGCETHGQTQAEAMARIEEIVKGYLASFNVPLSRRPIRVEPDDLPALRSEYCR